MLTIEPVEPSPELWAELDTFADRTVFQTKSWLDFLSETQGIEPVVAAVRDDGEVRGYVTGCLSKQFGVKLFGSPMKGWTTPYMGFNLRDDLSMSSALDLLPDLAFEQLGCQYLEFSDPRLLQADVPSLGATGTESNATREIDLTQSEDELFAAMKGSCRRAIRKAEKSGVVVEEVTDPEFAEEYYEQLIETFARQSLVPTYPIERVQSLITHLRPKDMLLLLRARNADGTSIATGIYPGLQGAGAVFFGGASLREYQNLRPNEAIMWYAMRYWKSRDCVVFDMSGDSDFKAKHGGEVTDRAKLMVGRSPLLIPLRNLVKEGFRVKQQLGWPTAEHRVVAIPRPGPLGGSPGSAERCQRFELIEGLGEERPECRFALLGLPPLHCHVECEHCRAGHDRCRRPLPAGERPFDPVGQLLPGGEVGFDRSGVELFGGVDVGDPLELELEVVGVPLAQCRHERRAHSLERRPLVELFGEGGFDRRIVLVPQHDPLLGAEVAVDRRGRHSHLLGDVLDRDEIEAPIDEHRERSSLGQPHGVAPISFSKRWHARHDSQLLVASPCQNRSHSHRVAVMTTATPARAVSPTTRGERHRFVDALRGFALLGILVVNIEFIVQPAEIGWAGSTSSTDQLVRGAVIALGQTKIYPLFALLFGYGLTLQLRRADAASAELWPRYRRRMIGLAVLGVAHGVLFFPGDILVIYAAVGAAAYAVRRRSTGQLVRLASWIYGLTALIWLGLGAAEAIAGPPTPPTVPADVLRILAEGAFGEVVAVHAVYWLATLAILTLVQGPAVFASFLAGIALGRTSLLADPGRHRDVAVRIVRWLPVAVVGAVAGAWLTIAGGRLETLGFAIGYSVAPLLAAGYVAGLALLLPRLRGLSTMLQASGRMSLSIYLLESVVASTLAYGYGGGLFGRVGPLAAVALAVAIWLGLSGFALVWMRGARFGPFEWLLRSFTYRRRQPLLRRS